MKYIRLLCLIIAFLSFTLSQNSSDTTAKEKLIQKIINNIKSSGLYNQSYNGLLGDKSLDHSKIEYQTSEAESLHPEVVLNLKEKKQTLEKDKSEVEKKHPHKKDKGDFLGELIKDTEKKIEDELTKNILPMVDKALDKLKSKEENVVNTIEDFINKEEKTIEEKINFLFKKVGGN